MTKVRTRSTVWSVWIAGAREDFEGASDALDAYSAALRSHGAALVSLERDGWRALSECQAAADAEASR